MLNDVFIFILYIFNLYCLVNIQQPCHNSAIGGCIFWQPVQADSQPKSSGLVLGWRPLGTILHSSNEPGELSQWLCHDDSTINILVIIIIIIIIVTVRILYYTSARF